MVQNRLKEIVFFIAGAVAILVGTTVIVFADEIETLKHGVVKITATNPNRIGTGVIVGVKGKTAYIATASHVIEGDPSPHVTFYQDRSHSYPAKIQGMEGGNPKGLAALVVEGDLPSGIRPLAFHPEAKFTGGEKVTVIGFPRLATVPWAVTEGSITGLVGPDLIFTGPAEEGNSGGPLLYNGKVVGLITEVAGSFKYAKPIVIAQYELKNWQLLFTAVRGSSPAQSMIQVPIGMVLVRGGTFLMGSTVEEVERDVKECEKNGIDKSTCQGWYAAEQPSHQVTLNSYYLDTHEVANEAFQIFVDATGYRTTAENEGNARTYLKNDQWMEVEGASWKYPEGKESVFASGRNKHPVVSVSWRDAKSYCEWAGKRLPTEAEWEYAARAGTRTKYWWGNENPGSRKVENMADESNRREFPGRPWAIMEGYDDGYVRTAPVGSFEANPWGIFDMGGNVREWVQDWYAPDYYQNSPRENPKGPNAGSERILRGGSWYYDPSSLRSTFRQLNFPAFRNANIGFRCAQDVL